MAKARIQTDAALLVGASPESRLGEAELKRFKQQARQATWIVAVDGGYRWLKKAGVKPHLYVGDLDSLEGVRLPESLPAIFLPHKKDCSDLQAALAIAAGLGANRFWAWGVWGGRLDHHWAALQDLGELARDRSTHQVRAFAPRVQAHWVSPGRALTLHLSAAERKGSVISLFAVGGSARGVLTQGLEYALKSETLGSGSRGLSNRAIASKISVSVKSGVVLMTLIHHDPRS